MIMACQIFATNLKAQVTGSFGDSRDGKNYKTLTINNQTWMAENLAYKADSGCWEYDNEHDKATYGCLYTWESAKRVCPSGWHLPSNYEFTVLTNFLGGDSIAGKELKETGTLHWESPNKEATNKIGFTALPGGYMDINSNKIMNISKNAIWWSSTEYNQDNACNLILGSGYKRAVRGKGPKRFGLSVRCIKD